MDELKIPVITCHTSRTRRPRMYQTSNRYNQARGSYTYTHRSTGGNKGINRQSSYSTRYGNIRSKGVNNVKARNNNIPCSYGTIEKYTFRAIFP